MAEIENTNLEIKKEEFRKPTIAQVCALFSVVMLLFIYIGSRLQSEISMGGLFMTQFLLILSPSILFIAIYKYDFKKVLRLNKIKMSTLGIIAGLTLLFIPIVAIVNLINTVLLQALFGRVEIPEIPISTEPQAFLINLIVIALVAGVCEEVLFRGAIQRGFEILGAKKSILITAFLFSIMHLDFQKFVGIFILGAFIGFLVYRTNSLYAGIVAHATNNAFAVMMMLLVNLQGEGVGEAEAELMLTFESLREMSMEERIGAAIGIFFLISFFIGIIIAFWATLRSLLRRTNNLAEDIRDYKPKNYRGFIWLTPAFIMVGVLYWAQALWLRETESETLIIILRFLKLI